MIPEFELERIETAEENHTTPTKQPPLPPPTPPTPPTTTSIAGNRKIHTLPAHRRMLRSGAHTPDPSRVIVPGSVTERRSIRCRCGGPAFLHPPRTPASKGDASMYPRPSARSEAITASTIFSAMSSLTVERV